MIGSEGISFPVARICVIETLNAEIRSHMQHRASLENRRSRNGNVRFGQLTIPCAVFCIVMGLTVALSDNRIDFMAGLVCSISVLIVLTALTYVACEYYRKNIQNEVVGEIKRIVCNYLDELEAFAEEGSASGLDGAVLSGNPHVSIVTVYRNMRWQRIPSLLLVEGDVVALMGGDISPGKVQELLPEDDGLQARDRTGNSNTGDFSLRKLSAKVIRKGDKIRLRKSKKMNNIGGHRSNRMRSKISVYGRGGLSAADMSSKQRTVSSNSLELLHFSGDIRCFVLRETPIAAYCRDILSNDLEQMSPENDYFCTFEVNVRDCLPQFLWGTLGLDNDCTYTAEVANQTFMASLFKASWSRGKIIFQWLLVILLVAALLRFVFIPESRAQWGQLVTIPVTTIAMCFFPVSLPLSMIFAEILTTASLLTSIETSLKNKGSVSLDQGISRGISNNNSASVQVQGPEHDSELKERSVAQQKPSHDTDEDEYNDEDIDCRAEKTAEKAYNEIYWSRLMKYIWHVAKTRLSRDMHTSRDSQFEEHFTSKVRDEAPSHKKHALSPSEMKYKSLRSESSTEINNEFERVDSDFEIQRVFSRILNNSTQGTEKVVLRDDLDMLPVPFARNRLVETLGSITRVCFVDDDVICEGFSVTEEIFLLNSADTVKGIGARSTMLDLHGNSKADGSRFEDPNWAKYLPSLKPMGLSAALTAEATPIPRRNSLQVDKAAVNAEGVTPRLPVVNETEPLEIGPDGNARRRGSSLSTTDADVAASAMETAFSSSLQVAAHESMAGSSPKGDSKIFSEETKHSREDNLNSFSSMLKNRQKYAKPITGSLEHSLIMHVRETIPSEVLTDLASEIGFVEEDISTFTRLVEMNVLAPCLGNDRVVEDTHLWGQEQTRRRGTLVSSARAVVVDDGRSGSMQLLSHGAPPLILSYCREYWDGAHITHISSADRKEVLDVYGRWALEDFDVVAFGYSPLPSYMEKIMHTSYNDNLERGRLSGRSTGFQRIRSRSMRFSNTSGASRYSPQDDAQDEFKANIGEGRNDLQTSCLFYVDPSTEGLMHLSAASRDRNTFKLIEEDNSEDEYYPPKSGETNRPHHHHHHRRHLGRGTTTENQEGPYIAKAYSISIDNSNSVENGTIVLRETALIGTSNELIQRSVSAGDANFLIKPESYSISEGTELFMDGSTVDSPSVNSRLSFHAASTLSGGSFLVEKSFDSTVTPNRSRSNKPLLIEDSMLRAQSGDELSRLGNMSPAGLRRMRSSSFSGDVAPARSELIVTDNDDIERGYQSDPCAEIFINVPESARERNLRDSVNYESDVSNAIRSEDEGGFVNYDGQAEGSPSPSKKERVVSIGWADEEPQACASRSLHFRRTASERPLEISEIRRKLSDTLIHHSNSDSYLLHNGRYGQHSAASLAKTVFELPMTSLNAEPHQLEDDIENEYVDIEAINDEQSNYIQSTAALLSSTGENVNMELASEISATKQQIVNDPLQIFSTSAEHVVSEASNNLDILSIDSNLLQCNPGGSIQKEAVSHITLKRSASFDMATLSLAAMETDNLLCTLNMKPLGDDVSNELKSCMLIQESMEASITSPKNMRDKILQSKDAILEEQSTHNSTSRKGGKKGRRSSGTSCSSGKPASLAGSIWPFLHEQIFLGMAASSVPVRPEAPEVLEDLQSAGIRFVFFSARNMRRSKRVAEKIGLQTDWNCAISLRDMEGDESLDPNRYEWDVKARLPHGVEAIKHHIQAVDNVPLLVSLFTDSTPDTIRQMINVFKEHGEVVLSVGCSYRAHNQEIFNASDVGVSVATLPGEMVIPSRVQDAAGKFPSCSRHSLCQADLLLVFGLIGIGAAPLLQIPFQEPKLAHILNVSSSKDPLLGKNGDSRVKRVYTWSSAGQMSDTDGSQAQNWSRNNTSNPDISLGIEKIETAFRGAPLRLPALLESVRKSRVFLLNAYQVLASLCICLLSLALWPVFAQAIPLTVPPVMPVPVLLLFLIIYVPILLLTMLFIRSSDNVMKNTPRKRNLVVKAREVLRFQQYLFARAGYIALSVACIGWMTSAANSIDDNSLTKGMSIEKWADRLGSFERNLHDGSFTQTTLAQYHHVQDVMSCQMLFGLIMQLSTMMERGQELKDLFEMLAESLFLYGALGCIVLHTAILTIRAWLRQDGFARYQYMRYDIWIAMVAFPLFGLIIGTVINALDEKSYRRYIQFLRLEFDTKLGMHSPK